MDGVTDYVFREIVATTAKPDILFTEFTNVEGLFSTKAEKTKERLKYSENQRYIVAQLWGKKPENYKNAARILVDLGYDGVDINMGCPADAVMKLNSGAALILNYTQVAEIINAIKEGAQGKLGISVKTRIGINTIVTKEWLSFLLNQNVDAITIHGRTAAELSKVPVHWDQIKLGVELKNNISPNTIILGNGDVKSYDEARQLFNAYQVDGLMLGKAIFSDPWVFDTSKINHAKNDYLELLIKHAKLYTETYPEKKRFNALKKYFLNYIQHIKPHTDLKDALMKCKTLEEAKKIVNAYKDA